MLPLLNSGYVSSLLRYVTFRGKFSIESSYGAFPVPNLFLRKPSFSYACALWSYCHWRLNGILALMRGLVMRIILILDLLLFS